VLKYTILIPFGNSTYGFSIFEKRRSSGAVIFAFTRPESVYKYETFCAERSGKFSFFVIRLIVLISFEQALIITASTIDFVTIL